MIQKWSVLVIIIVRRIFQASKKYDSKTRRDVLRSLRISSRIDKHERQCFARAQLEKLATNKKKKEPPLELPCFYRVAFVVRPPTPSSIASDTGRLLIFDSVEREYSLPEMRSVGRLLVAAKNVHP